MAKQAILNLDGVEYPLPRYDDDLAGLVIAASVSAEIDQATRATNGPLAFSSVTIAPEGSTRGAGIPLHFRPALIHSYAVYIVDRDE
jgi:hypothetical protein